MSELEYPERQIGPLEKIHDEIMHQGFLDRVAGKTAGQNPHTQVACETSQEIYDSQKEESWAIGWRDADRQASPKIEDKKL